MADSGTGRQQSSLDVGGYRGAILGHDESSDVESDDMDYEPFAEEEGDESDNISEEVSLQTILEGAREEFLEVHGDADLEGISGHCLAQVVN